MNATPAAADAAIAQTNATAARDMLHLTNGSGIISNIREVSPRGRIVPWNDILHEGPVPAGLGPAALRERRADFIAGCGWLSYEAVLEEITGRDRALDDALSDARCDEIVLWFEHDLYDQLQLIQILDRVPVDGGPRISLVRSTTYLGHEPASKYPALFDERRVVTSAERIAARDAWTAFRSADPRAIVDVLPRVTVLSHLGAALTRHLEQVPSMRNGLSRTEQYTLEAVATGATRLGDVFVATQEREDAFFMGDSGFLFHITPLIRSHRPLLAIEAGLKARRPEPFVPSDLASLDLHVILTSLGRSVLAGQSDRVELCAIDRWLGGVHLSGSGPVWRWDGERRNLRFV
jgi:hypothetical protein